MGMTQSNLHVAELGLGTCETIIYCPFHIIIFTRFYAQTTVQLSKTSKGAPIMFVDSIQISQADLQN
jgi:hypothetical protein